jgi:hypothetical protein
VIPVTTASIKAAGNAAASRGPRAATVARQARIDIPARNLVAAIKGPIARSGQGFGASNAPPGYLFGAFWRLARYTAGSRLWYRAAACCTCATESGANRKHFCQCLHAAASCVAELSACSAPHTVLTLVPISGPTGAQALSDSVVGLARLAQRLWKPLAVKALGASELVCS